LNFDVPADGERVCVCVSFRPLRGQRNFAATSEAAASFSAAKVFLFLCVDCLLLCLDLLLDYSIPLFLAWYVHSVPFG
jgi:hypothetical protein